MDRYRIVSDGAGSYDLMDGDTFILVGESMQMCDNVLWSLRHPNSGTDEAAEIADRWLGR